MPKLKFEDYGERLRRLIKEKKINFQQAGVILTIDDIYKEIPLDIKHFRRIYSHMDPAIIKEKSPEGITFLNIVKSKEPVSIIKHRLNSYMNIKFNDIEHFKSYTENTKTFQRYSKASSEIIEKLLRLSRFQKEIVDVLAESKEVKECHDFYSLLKLFKKAKTIRLKYEILRKIRLIVLIARINRHFVIEELDQRMKHLWKTFNTGLGMNRKKKKIIYYWLSAENSLFFTENKSLAYRAHKKEEIKRAALALPKRPLQSLELHPFRTYLDNEVLHIEARNKMKRNSKVCYSSIVEKMIRKNLEFPQQVHDVLGIRIVVSSEDMVTNVIKDLERFLGGSSTRKREKNSYHSFGKKQLNSFASESFFVWKAVYDIALPHPCLEKIKKLLRASKAGTELRAKIREAYKSYIDSPRDSVVEVQLQDLKSYILTIAKGSSAEHSLLKQNQFRRNSFYKLFPKEIYWPYLEKLKMRLLSL